MKKAWIAVLVFSFLQSASGLRAQMQPAEISKRLTNNYSALRQYSWNIRTEVRLMDQQISVTVEKIRYDLEGKLQITPLGGSGQLSPEMQPLINDLAKLSMDYAQPDPKAFERFFKKAEIWEGKRGGVGTIRIEGENFLRSGDYLDLRGRNNRAEQLEVGTMLNSTTPITINGVYRSLPNDGPTFVARLEVSVPEEEIEVIIESFDHTFNAPVAATDISRIPEGTELQIRLTAPLSSKEAQAGQEFQATLDQEVVVEGGTALKAGTPVTGEVVAAKPAGRAQGKGSLEIRLTSLAAQGRDFSIQTNGLKFEGQGTGKKTATRIGAGTGMGALIGGIAGGGSGAAKGAAIGAGVGVGATLLRKGNDVEFPAEQLLSFTLTESVEIGR
ncbi:MAG: hypothetical protein V3R94_08555 [Acidobacteriota bacterium]